MAPQPHFPQRRRMRAVLPCFSLSTLFMEQKKLDLKSKHEWGIVVLFSIYLVVVCRMQRLYFLRKRPLGKVAGNWGLTTDFSLYGELMLQVFWRARLFRSNKLTVMFFVTWVLVFRYKFLQVWTIFVPMCVKGKSEAVSYFGLNSALRLSIAKDTILNVNQNCRKLGQALLEYWRVCKNGQMIVHDHKPCFLI